MSNKKLIASLVISLIVLGCKPELYISKYKLGELVQLAGTKEVAQITCVMADSYYVRVSTITGPKELFIREFEIAGLAEVK